MESPSLTHLVRIPPRTVKPITDLGVFGRLPPKLQQAILSEHIDLRSLDTFRALNRLANQVVENLQDWCGLQKHVPSQCHGAFPSLGFERQYNEGAPTSDNSDRPRNSSGSGSSGSSSNVDIQWLMVDYESALSALMETLLLQSEEGREQLDQTALEAYLKFGVGPWPLPETESDVRYKQVDRYHQHVPGTASRATPFREHKMLSYAKLPSVRPWLDKPTAAPHQLKWPVLCLGCRNLNWDTMLACRDGPPDRNESVFPSRWYTLNDLENRHMKLSGRHKNGKHERMPGYVEAKHVLPSADTSDTSPPPPLKENVDYSQTMEGFQSFPSF
ncbi:hypothetical protein B0H66DRAFT_533423 [Apodospora peruviana]|uniref:Uncharacterized protein n=1 Tax=Apodospora peruviana TaxID=516989 RepID=A0AAE0M4D0_9PEZI|nr:hypothetical protein B0H66DRAFT_533423 [Apodospora peruviana]